MLIGLAFSLLSTDHDDFRVMYTYEQSREGCDG